MDEQQGRTAQVDVPRVIDRDALILTVRDVSADHHGNGRLSLSGSEAARIADAVIALFAQPTPATEPEVDVCLYCHGAGYYDGGDMRDDEPCNACRGTGLTEPHGMEDMASGSAT